MRSLTRRRRCSRSARSALGATTRIPTRRMRLTLHYACCLAAGDGLPQEGVLLGRQGAIRVDAAQAGEAYACDGRAVGPFLPRPQVGAWAALQLGEEEAAGHEAALRSKLVPAPAPRSCALLMRSPKIPLPRATFLW
eukprot:scaffold253913_cov30-Tisochrysis_lutea.AAC.1